MAQTIAVLIGRLIFGCVFLMAAVFKFTGMEATAGYIASIGFPFPLVFAWLAAFFELALVVAFFTGILFSQAAVLAALYVIFLAFAFHGPSTWAASPGRIWLLRRSFQLLCRPDVRSGARAGRQAGDQMAQMIDGGRPRSGPRRLGSGYADPNCRMSGPLFEAGDIEDLSCRREGRGLRQ